MKDSNNYKIMFNNWGWFVFKMAFLAGIGAIASVLAMICVALVAIKAVY